MKKLSLIIVTLLFTVTGALAQNFRTGYFLDGYMFKYQLNPAFQGERGFIALPTLGGTSLGVESNMSFGTFVYPQGEQLVSFLHPSVSSTDFMSQIKTNNPLNLNLDMNLLAFGFRVKNTYHTLDLSLKGGMNTVLPGDMFRFMKVGGEDGNTNYDFSHMSTNLTVYSQLAYGFSIKIKDFMSVGVRAKFLMGLQTIQSNIETFKLSLQPDKWSLNAGGYFMTSPIATDLITDNLDGDWATVLKGITKSPGYGAAFDLGISVDFLKHFTVSASVLDLGFMQWKNASKFNYGPASWEYSGFDNISIEGAGENLESTLNAKLDELVGIFKFDNPEQVDKYTQMLGFTSLLGLEFRMPFYTRLSIGALGTHRFEGDRSWTEGRFSLNYAPLRWLSLAGNYAISTFGQSYGAALNIHPAGFNLFVGLDSFKPLLNVTPQFIPIDEINTNLKVGLTSPFGKYNGRYPKKDKVGKE